MGKHYPLLPPHLVPFIKSQEIFYVATAPLAGGESGHVNVSPKGIRDSFWIGEEKDGNDLNLRLKGGEDEDVNKETKWIDEVWYDDLTGSGCETVAHLREEGNGRITIMFCAFEGPPNIVRIYGIGTVYEFGTPEYDRYIPIATRKPGSRAVIHIKINKVGTSCGYAIPFYTFAGHRRRLLSFASTLEARDRDLALPPNPTKAITTNATSDGTKPTTTDPSDPSFVIPPSGRYASMRSYWRIVNMQSIDGLPGLNVCWRTDNDATATANEGGVKPLTSVNVDDVAEKWAIVNEDVERAGGPARYERKFGPGGRTNVGVVDSKKRKAVWSLPAFVGESEEAKITFGFVMGIFTCAIIQGVVKGLTRK